MAAEAMVMERGYMTFDEARRIVEGKLGAYAFVIGNKPDAPIQTIYDRLLRAKELEADVDAGTRSTTSPQELWAIRHAQQIEDAARIERVMRRLPYEERHVIFLRYVEKNRWDYIARTLHMSRPTVYRVRDRALMAFAIEFGLIQTGVVS